MDQRASLSERIASLGLDPHQVRAAAALEGVDVRTMVREAVSPFGVRGLAGERARRALAALGFVTPTSRVSASRLELRVSNDVA